MKNENKQSESVIFTIKELELSKTDDWNFNLKIKVSDDVAGFFRKNDFNLTDREKEVLCLLSRGLKNNQIAQALSVSVHTVKAHVASILQKLSVDDRVQAAVKAVSEKLVIK